MPGQARVDDEEARAHLAALWGTKPPAERGLDPSEFVQAADSIGVLLLAGQDPISGWPRRFGGREILEGAGFVVCFDAFLGAASRYADVVLPVKILGERTGSVVALDGERRSLRRVFKPAGPLPQDGEIIRELARRLDSEMPSEEKILAEIDELCRWPRTASPIQRFFAAPAVPAPAALEGVLLDAAPQLFHSGTLTARSRHLQELSPTVAVRLSATDARRWDVQNGQMLRVASGERELLLRARIDSNVRPGTVVVPWNGNGDSAASMLVADDEPVVVEVRRS